MRCIKDSIIQKYVDKETSSKENSIVQSHLATCSKCIEKIERRKSTVHRIKQLMGSINKEEIKIPGFKEPEYPKKSIYIHFKKHIYAAAAACFLVLFLIFHQKPKNEIEIVYSYDIECEYNANLPISQQEMVIQIMDSEGKLIKD